MTNHVTTSEAVSRRNLLSTLPVVVGFGMTRQQTAGLFAADTGYVLQQGTRCIPIEPIPGDLAVEAFYDWGEGGRQRYSSPGTVEFQQPATSILFLYDGPDGVSLVIVHGQYAGDSPGGSATFEFEGLPLHGEWAVRDDFYDGPTNYDRWVRDGATATADWTWGDRRTDGGAFRGLDVDGLELTITPAFNEAAALYEQYYEGDIESWQLLSGPRDDLTRYELDLDEPVTIARGRCGPSGPANGGDPHGDDHPGEGKGHQKDNGKGHEKGQGEGHERFGDHEEGEEDDNSDEKSDSPSGQEDGPGPQGEAKGHDKGNRGKKRGGGRGNRRNDDDEEDDD